MSEDDVEDYDEFDADDPASTELKARRLIKRAKRHIKLATGILKQSRKARWRQRPLLVRMFLTLLKIILWAFVAVTVLGAVIAIFHSH
jgi:hypothetical protein